MIVGIDQVPAVSRQRITCGVLPTAEHDRDRSPRCVSFKSSALTSSQGPDFGHFLKSEA